MQTATRPIMDAAELAAHKIMSYGRNYAESDDGYGDMEAETRRGWRTVANWGHDGWDLGEWPYVVVYTHETTPCTACGANLAEGYGDGENGHWQNCPHPEARFRPDRQFELMQICEGDRTVYAFASAADRNAAMDYMFLWYSAGKHWSPLSYEDRARLDTGELTVDERYRGPCTI